MTKRKKDTTDKTRKPELAAVDAEPETEEEKPEMTSGTIDEIDRLRMSEANGLVLIQKNAAVALETEMKRLQAEAELVEIKRQESIRIGTEKQQELIAMIAAMREQYNIPETHGIQFKDGSVVPNPPQQQGLPPGAVPAPAPAPATPQ